MKILYGVLLLLSAIWWLAGCVNPNRLGRGDVRVAAGCLGLVIGAYGIGLLTS